jgi:predicted dehydrogenase
VSENITRRRFTQTGAAATLGLAAAGTAPARALGALGANDRVRLGMIGVGNRGGQLLDAFLEHADAEIVALCDVYQPYLERAQTKLNSKAALYQDFRKLLERNDIDAVVIATPDHWHALQTIAAANAGKDIYVEKPLSITIHEGRKMVEAARRNNSVVQVGTQRRSSPIYARLAELIQANGIGKVTVSRAYRLSNMHPGGIGKESPTDPPSDLDWDMWLGPRPMRDFQANIAPYKFRWWQLYSSQVANWGIHYLDAIRWLTGELAPASVCAMGGRFAIDDDRTIPDTLEVTFQFASGRLAVFGQYEACGNPALRQGELELRGTEGSVYVSGNRFEIIPERGGQFQDRTPRMKPLREPSTRNNVNLAVAHTRNFLDCVKSRQRPNADVEVGHRSTTCSLLANISLATRSRLEWDAQQETITNNSAANKLLHYEYREPWSLDNV